MLGTFQSVVYAQNSINGMIFDHNRRPIQDVYVELLDGFERLIRTTKTKNSGLYFFQNLGQGNYYVKVRTSGTSFKEQKVRINLGSTNRTIVTSSGTRTSGVDIQQRNFHLQLDPRIVGKTPSTTGVIFAQTVPEVAKKLYSSALKYIEKKETDLALGNLKEAISIFPDYFLALEELGELLLSNNKYEEAENIFLRTIKVNPKSFNSFWWLAVTQNKLKKKQDAIANLKKANELDGSSVNSYLLLGIIQRELKKYIEAEKSLLKAKKLNNGRLPEVHRNLALLYYYNFKRYSDAADELELYIEAIPKKERKTQKDKIAQYKKLIKTFRAKASKVSKDNKPATT